MNTSDAIWGIIVFLIIVILIARELACWYFKTSRIADELTRIRKLLEKNQPPAA